MSTLEEVLADAREEVQVLKRAGHTGQAAHLEKFVEAVARSAEDYLTWLTEADARLQSGRTIEWLRGRFPRWLDQGLARLNGKKREYRALIVPRRANVSAAKEAGRRAARERRARDSAA